MSARDDYHVDWRAGLCGDELASAEAEIDRIIEQRDRERRSVDSRHRTVLRYQRKIRQLEEELAEYRRMRANG